jgi:hypothetical protein
MGVTHHINSMWYCTFFSRLKQFKYCIKKIFSKWHRTYNAAECRLINKKASQIWEANQPSSADSLKRRRRAMTGLNSSPYIRWKRGSILFSRVSWKPQESLSIDARLNICTAALLVLINKLWWGSGEINSTESAPLLIWIGRFMTASTAMNGPVRSIWNTLNVLGASHSS